MPSSYHGFINEVLDRYVEDNPQTVLDVGCGHGKWGFLFREYGDVFRGRFEPSTWQVEITGVEIFFPYVKQHHHYIYNQILVGDISVLADSLPGFDFGYAGDVIEHLPKPVAVRTLKTLRSKCRRLAVCIPLGLEWAQGAVFGNDAEEHRSVWTARDFEDCTYKMFKRNNRGKEIGLFIW